MRRDLSEARSVMVEEASERSRKRERGREEEGERGRKFLVLLGQEEWFPLQRCGERKRLVNPQPDKKPHSHRHPEQSGDGGMDERMDEWG